MRAIPGYPGYFASKSGKIYTSKAKGTGRLTDDRVRMPGYVNKQGRLRVAMYKDGVKYQEQISRLIALTFIPNPKNYPIVLHMDNNHLNNNFKNLKWGTQSQNVQQSFDEGRSKPPNKVSQDHIDIILGMYIPYKVGIDTIAMFLKIGRSTVSRVIKKYYVKA